MKPRRVIITLEVETDASLRDLKSTDWWADGAMYGIGWHFDVHQAQANVVRKKKKKS